MTWKLFLDDIRLPSDIYAANSEWVVSRTMREAIHEIVERGVPRFISFDHDLAIDHYDPNNKNVEETGYDFAKWFCEYAMINKIQLDPYFGYYVHSMNPVGKRNIEEYMKNFLHNYKISE